MSKTSRIEKALRLLMELSPESVENILQIIKNTHATEYPEFTNDRSRV